MSVVNNPKYVNLVKDDECVIDRHVNQLNWGVIKFISPEDMIQKKAIFDLNRFLFHNVNQQLVDICTNICMNLTNEFNNNLNQQIERLEKDITPNSKATVEALNEVKQSMQMDPEFHSARVLRQYRLDQDELNSRFETYKLENRRELEQEFGQQVNQRTSLRGFKLSGAFETLEEARKRAKHVNQDIEPNINAYAVPLNVWVPWDPNPDAIQDQEYQLEELNDLIGKYNDNTQKKNEFFEKRKREMIDKTRAQNNEELKKQIAN